MAFDGLRVLAFESRRSAEIGELIRRQGGLPFVAPSLREAPVESNEPVFRFAGQLERGEFEMLILLTGVGTRALAKLLEGRMEFAAALRRLTVVARGPKPVAALREIDVRPDITVPEPNTWRELMAAIAGRPERKIAVQEYGRRPAELLSALGARGAEVTSIQVYQYELPGDTGPLREAARRLASGEVDVAIFTTAIQMVHLARVAAQDGIEEAMLAGLRRSMVASIGPTTTEALAEFGVTPALEPSHPKMGFLIKEAAEFASARREG